MKKRIDENGKERWESEPDGKDWLDDSYRNAVKEIDEEVVKKLIKISEETPNKEEII